MALTKKQHSLRIKKGKQKARDQRARAARSKAVRLTVVFLTQREADEAAKLIRTLPGFAWLK